LERIDVGVAGKPENSPILRLYILSVNLFKTSKSKGRRLAIFT